MSEQELVDSFIQTFQDDPDASVGIATIKVLTDAVVKSKATTFMGVDQEINKLISAIQARWPDVPKHFISTSQVFRNVLSTAGGTKYEDLRDGFIANANKCLGDAQSLLNLIPEQACVFLQHGMTIMTNGFDPMILRVLRSASATGKQFHIVVTEGRPRDNGCKLYQELKHYGNLRITVIPDSSIGLWMDKVSVVLVGTDVVLQDGSLLAPTGTYTMCAMASLLKRPVYCVTETYKFMRKYVLGSLDLQELQKTSNFSPVNSDISFNAEYYDLTPAKYVTLLLTERGPVPPSAVTNELTKLFGVF